MFIRQVERRVQFFGLGVDVRAARDQLSHDTRVASPDRMVQRSPAVFTLGVDVRAARDEHLRRLEVSELDRMVQRRATVPVLGVDVGSIRDQQRGYLRVAFNCVKWCSSQLIFGLHVRAAADEQRDDLHLVFLDRQV